MDTPTDDHSEAWKISKWCLTVWPILHSVTCNHAIIMHNLSLVHAVERNYKGESTTLLLKLCHYLHRSSSSRSQWGWSLLQLTLGKRHPWQDASSSQGTERQTITHTFTLMANLECTSCGTVGRTRITWKTVSTYAFSMSHNSKHHSPVQSTHEWVHITECIIWASHTVPLQQATTSHTR